LAFVQTELLKNLVNSLHLLFVRALELELGSEFKALFDCHGLEEDVVLLHVGRESREVGLQLTPLHAVDKDVTLLVQVLAYLPPRQIVQQGCLAGSYSYSDVVNSLAREVTRKSQMKISIIIFILWPDG
jgi:glycosyltransferase involved in cell wall biosynthesis